MTHGADMQDKASVTEASPAPQSHVRVWTQADIEREHSAFTKWFTERRYVEHPDLYPLTTENAMHSAWQEAAKRTALATTEGQQNVEWGDWTVDDTKGGRE